MDKNQAQKQIRDIFQHPFQRANYLHFLRNLLNQIEPRDAHYTGNLIPDSFKEHVTQYWRVGKYIDPDGIEMDLLVVEVKSLSKLDRARSALRNFAVNRLKQFGKDCSLVAFYAKDDGGADWRFSYVKIEHEAHQDGRGKIRLKTELTPAKRYSYLVGVHENSHTACQQLMPLLVMDYANPRIEEIEKAFSIEKVTDEFFEQYKGLYLKLSEQLKSQPFFKKQTEEENTQTVARFAKKLLGQIVFLYFLQKKGWLGVAEDGKWGDGSRRFMRDRFTQITTNEGNYYHDFLQYLFYEALAKERKHQPDPDYYERFSCKIPFLNGGLFEAEYDDWHNLDIDLPNNLFHNDEKNKAGDIGTGILDVFDRYNFTIKEDEPLEKEVAVDPEMLGKVFENMLEITERKSKGAFYTPREIVHYMCQESLINYLDNSLNSYAKLYQTIDSDQPILFGGLTDKKGQQKLEITHQDGIKVPKEDLETLIRKGHLFVENDEAALQALQRIESGEQKTTKHKIELPESIKSNAEKIDNCLASIRVCDPAIGSGAFPVGLLHEIVNARLTLAPHSDNKMSVYELKRHTIHECLYGVDLDASAVDIARLRLWLSLIVDEDDFNTDKALPNLDYKIVCGNSLIGFPDDWKSQAADKIEEMKKVFFDEKDQEEKIKKKKHIDAEIQARIANSKQNFGYQVDFDFKLYFSEVWHEKGGFDVVIGNPPYLREKGNANVFHPVNVSELGKLYHQGKMDYWFYFLHKSINIINNTGSIGFITSRYWINSTGSTKLIKRVKNELNFYCVVDIGKLKVFDNVVGHHMISLLQKQSTSNKLIYKKLSNDISDIYETTNTNNLEIAEINCGSVFTDNDEINFSNESFLTIKDALLLDEIYDTSVGIQESPDKLTKKMIEASNRTDIEVGKGVFVLNNDELEQLALTENELKAIKPYLDPSDVNKYVINNPSKYIIYSDSFVRKQIATGVFSNIKKHLDNLSEFITSSNGPYGLHRPRDIKYFNSPKIVFKGMFSNSEFALDTRGIYFIGFSFSSIISKNNSYSLRYLLSILNSSFGNHWFSLNGKQRGIGYDIGVLKLRQFPVKNCSSAKQIYFEIVVDYLATNLLQTNHKLQYAFFEEIIDGLVYELYFHEEIKAANKEILKHLGELKPITDDMSDEEKLAVIQSEFERLYDPKHPVRNNLETLDSVEEVRIIREALKK